MGHGLNVDLDCSKLSAEEAGHLYRMARTVRLAMQKETDLVEALEKRAKERVIELTPVGKGFIVGGYAFETTRKEKPTIKDWDKLTSWIVQTGRFDVLQKRLADKAVTDTDNWHTLPGIERFNHIDLSVTKR